MPVFAFTTTYQKRGVTVYVDGPFMPDRSQPAKAQREELAQRVHAAMTERAKASTFQHVIYRRQTP